MRRSLIAVLAFAGLSCRDPRAEANIAQAMAEVGTTLTMIQQDYSELQNQVDSLRQIIAKQDTVIRQLAILAGVPVR